MKNGTCSTGEVLEPPSYNVAVSLPSYDESLRAKQQEEDADEQQQLREHSTSPEVSVIMF